ncbi:MAG TPA: response regulator [Verrucomicrobiae bacterium]|nr:response regulator [Verrucomicrobiae bacterium]
MPTLLLVEDNLHIQRIYRDKLQREGFRVVTADDGAMGAQRAAEIHPDLIVLDVMLPKLDGFQVLAKLRADPALCHIPVFMLSNRATSNDVQRATSLGARQFFAKGTLKLQDVVRNLRTACGLKQILLFTSAQAVAPIATAVEHSQLLCSVVTVALEFIGTVERGAPDLVIIDGRAPNASTVLQQLRASPHVKRVPLITIRDPSQTHRQFDDFVDSDRIETDLRPLVLAQLGLVEPAPATPSDAPPVVASA